MAPEQQLVLASNSKPERHIARPSKPKFSRSVYCQLRRRRGYWNLIEDMQPCSRKRVLAATPAAAQWVKNVQTRGASWRVSVTRSGLSSPYLIHDMSLVKQSLIDMKAEIMDV